MCSQAGVYVLQWKYKSCPTVASVSSKPQNKAKIMVFYEIIKGTDFK